MGIMGTFSSFLFLLILSLLAIFHHASSQEGDGLFPPKHEHLIGYWPLDSESKLTDLHNSKRLITWPVEINRGTETNIKLPGDVDPGPGPFFIYETSWSSGDVDQSFFSMNYTINLTKTGVEITPSTLKSFTATLFYYHDEEKDGQTTFFRLGSDNNFLEIGYSKSDVIARFQGAEIGERLISWQKIGFEPKSWHFFAFTYDSATIQGYHDFSSAIFANETLIFTPPSLDPKLKIAMLRRGDKIACIALFDTVLPHSDIAELPKTCQEIRKKEVARFGIRRFYGQKPENLLGFWPMDPQASCFEATNGLGPSKFGADLHQDGEKSGQFLAPSSDGSFVSEFFAPQFEQKTVEFSTTFYLYCAEPRYDILGKIQLLNWNNKFLLSLQDCNRLEISILPDRPNFSISMKLIPGKWNLLGLTYHQNGTMHYYREGLFMSPVPGFNDPIQQIGETDGEILIGPTRKTSLGLACLSLYNTSLSTEDHFKSKCYCPGYGRRSNPVPDFLAKECANRGPNVLQPRSLSQATLFVLFDDDLGVGNAPNYFGQNYGKFQAARLDLQREGPLFEGGTSFGVDERSQLARYEDLPPFTDDFTVAFFFRADKSGSERTILKIEQEDSTFLEISLANNFITVKNADKEKGRFEFSGEQTWRFFAMTYRNASNHLIFHRKSGDKGLEIFGEVDKLFPGTTNSESTSRLTVGELESGDRISCLFVDQRPLLNQEIARITCFCRWRGRCPEGRTLMPPRLPQIPSGPEDSILPIFAVPLDKDNGLTDVINGSQAISVSDLARVDTTWRGAFGSFESYRNVPPYGETLQLTKMASYMVPHGLFGEFSITFYLNMAATSKGGEVVAIKTGSGDRPVVQITYSALNQTFEIAMPMKVAIFKVKRDPGINNWAFFGVSIVRETGEIYAFDHSGCRVEAIEERKPVTIAPGSARHRRQISSSPNVIVSIGKIYPGDKLALFKLFNVSIPLKSPPPIILTSEGPLPTQFANNLSTGEGQTTRLAIVETEATNGELELVSTEEPETTFEVEEYEIEKYDEYLFETIPAKTTSTTTLPDRMDGSPRQTGSSWVIFNTILLVAMATILL